MLDVTTTITIHGEEGERFRSGVPCIGDTVRVRCDALVEVGRHAPGLPPGWQFLPAGTTGTLLGWRDRDGESRAIVDVDGTDRRLVVYVSVAKVTRAQPAAGQVEQRLARAGVSVRRAASRRRH